MTSTRNARTPPPGDTLRKAAARSVPQRADKAATVPSEQAGLAQDDKERRIENTIDFAISHFEEFGIIGAEYSPV